MRLLKIGTLNLPRNRWEDALDVFSDIDVFCFDSEVEIQNEHIHYIKFDTKQKLSFFLFRAARHFNYNKKQKFFCNICLVLIRFLNRKLIQQIRNKKYDFVHSSYNDFDESAFLTVLLKPGRYTRSQKETRLYYTYFEEETFKNAYRIVLNDPMNLDFFKKKYSDDIFKNKTIIYGLDEDVRTKRLLNKLKYDTKLSEKDGKIHAVILAGRVLSNPTDSRSGGRLYYVNLIKDLLNEGIVVHLHTANIIPFNGTNPYQDLAKEYTNFHIENKLDFTDDYENAYKILSRYDIGICHAHLPNTEVTEFDRINIPHRYYEYHLAHVVPVDLRGGNFLLEMKAKMGFALIYDNYHEIKLNDLQNIKWDIPTFSEYMKKLYLLAGNY